MRIPTDPIGYLVELNGTIHTRYAGHAQGQRTRTEKGVKTLLEGKKGKVCPECFPANRPPPPDDTPRPPQRRRIPSIKN